LSDCPKQSFFSLEEDGIAWVSLTGQSVVPPHHASERFISFGALMITLKVTLDGWW
jgi:hypothetical protein